MSNVVVVDEMVVDQRKHYKIVGLFQISETGNHH